MKRLSRDSFCPQEAPPTRAQDSSPTSTSTRTRAAPAHDDRRHHPRRTGRSGPRGLARSPRFSTARHQSSFRRGEEFRRWTADARWSRGGPRSGPPSALRDANTMSQRDHTGPREGKRRAEKPALVSVSIWVSLDSSPWPSWLIVVCLSEAFREMVFGEGEAPAEPSSREIWARREPRPPALGTDSQ